MSYFVGQMGRGDSLGQFEQLVVTAVLTLGDNAYGISIHEKVQRLSQPKPVALGAVYVTLDRLEEKRLVSSWLSEPTRERGGRARRHYRVEPAGEKALEESVLAARRVWDALDALGSPRFGRRLRKAAR
jgi:PadR family transcriptional regulator PadR